MARQPLSSGYQVSCEWGATAALRGEPGSVRSTLEAVDELHGALKKGVRVGVAPGAAEDELYIMTGGAEGITVKVLRRGR